MMTTRSLFQPVGRPVAAYRPLQVLLDEFAASLVGLSYDDVTVLRATAVLGSWTAADHVYVQLFISDPPAGRETWEVETLREIRMETRRRAAEAGIEEFVDVGTTGGPDDDDEPEPPPRPGKVRPAGHAERSEPA
jgi:hypothetical protein